MLIVVLQYLGGIGNQTNLYNETIYCLVRPGVIPFPCNYR